MKHIFSKGKFIYFCVLFVKKIIFFQNRYFKVQPFR